MGGGVSVEVLGEQDSIANPSGGKVIMSASLDEIPGVDYVAFSNELSQIMKSPPPFTDLVLKTKEYNEIDGNPDDFKFKVVLDGAKMKSYGFGDGEDVVAVNRRVTLNRKERKMECWEYMKKGDPATMTSFSVTNFLKDPFRIEGYLVVYPGHPDAAEDTPKEGKHFANEVAVGIWKGMFIDPICTTISRTKVKCTADQPASDGSGKLVIVSDRVDEYVTVDALTTGLLPFLKAFFEKMSSEDNPVDIKQDTENDIMVTANMPSPTGGKSSMVSTGSFNPETLEYKEEVTLSGTLARTRYIKIVWPRLESYVIQGASGERVSGGNYARDFTQFLNGLVEHAEQSSSLLSSVGSWFS